MTNFMSTVDKLGRIFLIFCLTYIYLYIKEGVKKIMPVCLCGQACFYFNKL